MSAPFEILPSVPAVELAEGGLIRFGELRLRVLHTPGHTEGSVCLLAEDDGILFSGDTLFAGGWGRTDLPGGDEGQMVESLVRLSGMDDPLRVLPGHGSATTIGRERPWLELVRTSGRCSPEASDPRACAVERSVTCARTSTRASCRARQAAAAVSVRRCAGAATPIVSGRGDGSGRSGAPRRRRDPRPPRAPRRHAARR